MDKGRGLARWTASTGATLAGIVVAALIAAPLVSAQPGEGGGEGADPIAALFGGGDKGGEEGGDKGGERGDEGGRHDGRDGPAAGGRAMSRGETDSYALALRAHGEGEDTRGRLFFGHRSESGDEGFAGEITCLSVGDDGVVQVSGTTREGRRHRHDHGDHRRGDSASMGGGGKGDGAEQAEAAGKDFAFTILTRSDPQQFSLPKLADAGTLAPCSGGDATTVAVTRGGFRSHS